MTEASLLRKIRALRDKILRARRLADELLSDRPARSSLVTYAEDLERRVAALERQLSALRDKASSEESPDGATRPRTRGSDDD